MQRSSRFRRRLAVMVGSVALLTSVGFTAGAATPASAEAAVSLRVTCWDVLLRVSPGGQAYSIPAIPQNWVIPWLEWPTTPGWIKTRYIGVEGWVDANCVTLA